MIPSRLLPRLARPDRLLRRFARTGDPQALGELFDRAAPELLRVAVYLSGSRADAEDLLQRTFVTVIERRANYDRRRPALPWLCGILGNHARKLHDKRAREAHHHRHLIEAAADGSVKLTDPSNTASEREVVAVVDRLRNELDSPYREVLDLHLGRGLTPAEIAARLDRPAGTVRTQLVRGLQRLRERLPLSLFSPAAAATLLSHGDATAQLAGIRATIVRAAETARPAGAAPAPASFGLPLGGAPTFALAALVTLGLAVGAFVLFDRPAAGPVQSATAPVERSGPIAGATGAAADRQLVTEPARGTKTAAPTKDQRAAGGRRIAVRVVDADGVPVQAARVWLSEPHLATRGSIAGRSDERGEHTLRFDAARFVGARHPDHVRSYLALVDPETAGDVVTLALRGPSSPFRGRVFDAAGNPLADAAIALGPPGGWRLTNSPHQRTVYPPRAATRTDAAGEFAVSGLEPGQAALEIRAADHAPLTAEVEVPVLAPGGRAPVATFRLQRGAVIVGHVQNADGAAAAAAEVVAIDDHGRRTSTSTDAAGDFVLAGLAAGPLQLTAAAASATADSEFGTAAAATANGRRDGVLGTTIRWDPTLHPTRLLPGRVIDAAGDPVAGVQVLAGAPTMDPSAPAVTTGRDGRFRLPANARSAAKGALYVRRGGAPITVRHGVIPALADAPAATELIVQLTADEAPTAVVTGRLVDPAGRPVPASISVTNHAFAVGWYEVTNRETGAFRLGPTRPGSYTLIFEAAGFGRVPVRVLDAAPGQVRDLGDLVVRRAGHVRLALAGTTSTERRLVKFARQDGVISHVFSDGRPVVTELAPGDYVATVVVGDGAGSTTRFAVASGTTSTVTLPCTTNPPLDLALAFAAAATPAGRRVDVVITDSGGNFFDAHELSCDGGQAAGLRIHLPPGRYRLECRSTDGLTAIANVSIRSDTKPPMRRLLLR